jgi:PadR family transcriptional regulator, regulatory protein AphA
MSIEYAILGLLSLRSLSGYDIKKIFSGTAGLYYSDNNNQIYRTLVNLHQEEMLMRSIVHQEDHPSRKVYTITEKGIKKLKQWVLLAPELPQWKHSFIIQLAWADQLQPEELDSLLSQYEDEILMQLLICRKQKEQKDIKTSSENYINISLARTKREAYLWSMIQEKWILYFKTKLNWIQKIRQDLLKISEG